MIDIFKDNEGHLSSMRIMSFFVTITILFNWTYVVLTSGTFVVLDAGSVSLLGVAMGAKVWQKHLEEKSGTPS